MKVKTFSGMHPFFNLRISYNPTPKKGETQGGSIAVNIIWPILNPHPKFHVFTTTCTIFPPLGMTRTAGLKKGVIERVQLFPNPSLCSPPRLWNHLPTKLKSCHSITRFKSLLKTHFVTIFQR